MRETRAFRTSDGALFEDRAEAARHEAVLKIKEALVAYDNPKGIRLDQLDEPSLNTIADTILSSINALLPALEFYAQHHPHAATQREQEVNAQEAEARSAL